MIAQYANPGMKPMTMPDGTQNFISSDGYVYDIHGQQQNVVDASGNTLKYNPETDTFEPVQ
jgi:hypothetical protein